MLFNYYVSETALQIVASPGIKNPFLNIVLPLAFSDQLVMNGVLALAGAHIRYDESLNEQTVAATWSHHSQVLRDLQIALSRNQLDQERETLRILLVITILCIIESISGNPQDTFLHHLHASRELVLSIMSKPKGIENPANRELWGFLLEMYSYMVLVAAITPSGASNTPKVTLDGFLHSTEGVSQHGVCGNFFSGKNSIFEFVPEVSLLTSQRRREEETGTCSKESYAKYKDIVSRIRSWSMVEPADVDTVADLRTQRAAASILWQSALLIYLHSSFCEALQDDASLVAEIDIRIESASPLLGSLVLTPLGAIMMWPSMIIGSCARQKKQWEMFRTIGTMYRMNAVKHSLGLLTLLWQDPDPRAYGPRGLDFVMRKKGSNIIMF
ncbi:fungal-specific transcription factor domain-containing protein [Tricladium varicosporioides]|nr:fungal-specific transcription factor domain-containing protein [Hymenoscyphus varicosporioides]